MWMSAKTAGQYADVNERTIRNWFKTGLESRKIGGSVRTKAEWIDAYIENNADQEVLDKVVSIIRWRK